jgi:hypothetical protein
LHQCALQGEVCDDRPTGHEGARPDGEQIARESISLARAESVDDYVNDDCQRYPNGRLLEKEGNAAQNANEKQLPPGVSVVL